MVLKLQQRINASFDEALSSGRDAQVVIYGKRGHAEVNGLVGQTRGTAIVIESVDEIDRIDYSRDVSLFADHKVARGLQANSWRDPPAHHAWRAVPEFRHHLPLSGQPHPQIREFASQHQLILFVCGKKSSNGRILFAQCHDANPDSHLITSETEIDNSWLEGRQRIGICGATSTPMWLMNRVRDYVDSVVNSHQ